MTDHGGISTHGDNEAVADCDLVVEAAIERMDLKQGCSKSWIRSANRRSDPGFNTSSLSLTGISKRHEPRCGWHALL